MIRYHKRREDSTYQGIVCGVLLSFSGDAAYRYVRHPEIKKYISFSGKTKACTPGARFLFWGKIQIK